MLETIRAFGLERLAVSGEGEDARDRHAAFFRGFIADLDLFKAFPGDDSWFSRVAPEEDNLRQALERFLARGDALALSELSSGLTSFWLTRSQFGEARRWLELAIAGDQDLPAPVRARAPPARRASSRRATASYAVAVPCSKRLWPWPATAAIRPCCGTRSSRWATWRSTQGDYARAMALHEEEEQAARAVDPADVPNAGLLCGGGALLSRRGRPTVWR